MATRDQSQRVVSSEDRDSLTQLFPAITQDIFDMKPDSPKEVRSQFKPIATSASGIEICEHLPQMAKWMQKAAIVRTVNHKAGRHNTLPSYTGHEVLLPDVTNTKNSYPSSMGSMCEYLRATDESGQGELPDYVYVPCYLSWGQNIRCPCPYGGFLGKRFDALTTERDPFKAKGTPNVVPGSPQTALGPPRLADSRLPEDITLDRLNTRRGLLKKFDDELRRIDRSGSIETFSRQKQKAFEILGGSDLKTAFELDSGKPELIDRYGRTLFSNSTLIRRRLVERGVRFVNVTWDLFWDRVKLDYDAWDTHTKNFPILRDNKLPGMDKTYSTLMEDLAARGFLDETLVVVMSKMGRTPRINGEDLAEGD